MSQANDDEFGILRKHLNNALSEIAEVYIEEKAEELRIRLRKELAAGLISKIESQVSIDRLGTDLRITIRGKNAL